MQSPADKSSGGSSAEVGRTPSPVGSLPAASSRSHGEARRLSSPSAALATLPPLPGPEILDLILGRYFSKLYETFPQTIRSLLVKEIGLGRRLPTFFSAAITLWSCRWDPDLGDILGPELRDQTMQLLFNRLQAELLPALEIVLAGFDAMVGHYDDRPTSDVGFGGNVQQRNQMSAASQQYVSLTVWVLQSLVHLLAGLMSNPSMDSKVLTNFQAVVRLAMNVARVSRFGDEELYGRPISSPWDSDRGRVSYYSSLIERGRRAWWGIVSIDCSFATIHGIDPVIEWLEFSQIKISTTDVIYQAVSGEIDGTEIGGTSNATYWSTGKPSIPDTVLLPEGSAVIFQTFQRALNWSVGPVAGALGSNPILTTSILPDGAFSPQSAATRIAQINCQIAAFRRLRLTPWRTDPTRSYLLAHLRSWFEEVPQTFKTVEKILASVPRPIPAGVGTLVLLNLMYLFGMISLYAPADDALWSGTGDEGWIQSEACVEARKYSDKVTDLIAPLVEEVATVPQLGLPVSISDWNGTCPVFSDLCSSSPDPVLSIHRRPCWSHPLHCDAELGRC